MAIDLALLLVIEAATVILPRAETSGCGVAGPDEIVICKHAVDPDRYRLPRMTLRDDAAGPPRAEWGLGGGVRAGVAASSQAMPQGAVSQRVMATIKIPF